MRRILGLVAVTALCVMSGCGGDSQQFSDGRIADALQLQQRGNGYTVGNNPFCAIDKILNDADETSGLSNKQQRLAITSRRGNIGVVVVTPFAPACEKSVTAALNKLDRDKKSKS